MQVPISAQCFSLYSYFGERTVREVYGFIHKKTWLHNDVTFRHCVNQIHRDVENDGQFCVKLVAASTGAVLKFKRRALNGPTDARTPRL